MALYAGSALSVAGIPTTGASADLKANPLGGTAITEMSLHMSTGSSGQIQIGRATTELFQVNSAPLLPYDPADKPTLTGIASAWTIAPVSPTQFLRRWSCTNGSVNGPGVIWSFPRALRLGPAQSLVVWSIYSTNNFNPMYVNVEVDE